MPKILETQENKKGKPPGDLTFVGSKQLDRPTVEVFDYSENQIESLEIDHLKELSYLKDSKSVSWVNIEGLHDVGFIQELGEIFDLHPLLLEDTLNTTQRPKFEEFDDYFFIAVKMLTYNDHSDEIEMEHTSFVVAKNYVITIQEGRPGDVFKPIRERLQRSTSKIRSRGTDYLAYSLLDVIVDNYISIIEGFGEKIERLEEKLIDDDGTDVSEEINRYKKEINFLRKTVRPTRELAAMFWKCESDIIDERTVPYLNDLIDNIAHASESIETYQIMLNDQLHILQTQISNRLNEILRVLTVFSVVFIPLTFIAGVYGTNFKYFPELEFQYAYPVFWGILITTAGLMLLYFKRKRWL